MNKDDYDALERSCNVRLVFVTNRDLNAKSYLVTPGVFCEDANIVTLPREHSPQQSSLSKGTKLTVSSICSIDYSITVQLIEPTDALSSRIYEMNLADIEFLEYLEK